MNNKSKVAITLLSLLTLSLTGCDSDSNNGGTITSPIPAPTTPTTPTKPTTPTSNLLVNGDFETWADGKPTGWTTIDTWGVTAAQNSATFKAGLNSGAFTVTKTKSDVRQSIDVVAGKTYTLSTWIYHTEGTVKVRLYINDVWTDMDKLSNANKVNEWQELKLSYTSKTSANIVVGPRFYTQTGFNGSEIVYLDNVTFTETAATEPTKPIEPTKPVEPIKPIDLKTYYDSAKGKTGFELKTALHNIIKGHKTKSYGDLWTFMAKNSLDKYTQYENDGTILDMYSENPSATDSYNFTPVTDQDKGSHKNEGDTYNREHSFPKSWFDDASPMYTDIHHLFATDSVVNGKRGNFPYGEVGVASFISKNGSKLGSARAGLGYTGTVFEPIDEFKGDFARGHFYMATRYQDIAASWEENSVNSNAVLNGTGEQVFEDWVVTMLKRWHSNDPVSQKEIDRNAAAAVFQGNRNPYVDNPEYVSEIWGN